MQTWCAKRILSGGGDGREHKGWLACNLDDPSEVRLGATRLSRGRLAPEGARRACSLGPDIVPHQDPLEHRVIPKRNLDQRMDALRAANEVRSLRAQLKRDLKAGRVSLGPLLLDPPPYLETAKVFDMLLALPKHGRVKATKVLQSCQVSPSKTFGGLSERQRAELAERLHRS
jgi:hypothetical protein